MPSSNVSNSSSTAYTYAYLLNLSMAGRRLPLKQNNMYDGHDRLAPNSSDLKIHNPGTRNVDSCTYVKDGVGGYVSYDLRRSGSAALPRATACYGIARQLRS